MVALLLQQVARGNDGHNGDSHIRRLLGIEDKGYLSYGKALIEFIELQIARLHNRWGYVILAVMHIWGWDGNLGLAVDCRLSLRYGKRMHICTRTAILLSLHKP